MTAWPATSEVPTGPMDSHTLGSLSISYERKRIKRVWERYFLDRLKARGEETGGGGEIEVGE